MCGVASAAIVGHGMSEKGLALSLEVDIEKKFRGFHLSQQFSAGDETLGLLGASGCGKSLTMRSITESEKPDAGKIVVNDTVLFRQGARQKAKVDLSPQQRKNGVAVSELLRCFRI